MILTYLLIDQDQHQHYVTTSNQARDHGGALVFTVVAPR